MNDELKSFYLQLSSFIVSPGGNVFGFQSFYECAARLFKIESARHSFLYLEDCL